MIFSARRVLKEIKYWYLRRTYTFNVDSDIVVKYVIIGTGYMAETYANTVQKDPDSLVVGVVSRCAQRASEFAKKFAIPAYTDRIEAILDLSPDIVYVATPVETHFEIVKRILSLKLNVLCEKPLVYSSSDAQTLQDCASANDVFLIEGMWSYFTPIYHALFELIESRKFGNLEHIELSFSKKQAYTPSQPQGDVIFDFGIYALGLVARLFEKPKIRYSSRKANNLDQNRLSCTVACEDSKAVANINVCRHYQGQNNCVLYFSNGVACVKGPFNRSNHMELLDFTSGKRRHLSFTSGFEYQNRFVIDVMNGNREEISRQIEFMKRTYKLVDELF